MGHSSRPTLEVSRWASIQVVRVTVPESRRPRMTSWRPKLDFAMTARRCSMSTWQRSQKSKKLRNLMRSLLDPLMDENYPQKFLFQIFQYPLMMDQGN